MKYIGMTHDYNQRKDAHFSMGKSGSKVLTHDMKQHGIQYFHMQILQRTDSLEKARFLEGCSIIEHQTLIPTGYNVSLSGVSSIDYVNKIIPTWNNLIHTIKPRTRKSPITRKLPIVPHEATYSPIEILLGKKAIERSLGRLHNKDICSPLKSGEQRTLPILRIMNHLIHTSQKSNHPDIEYIKALFESLSTKPLAVRKLQCANVLNELYDIYDISHAFTITKDGIFR